MECGGTGGKMSNTWITNVYFPKYSSWPTQVTEDLVNNLLLSGLSFPTNNSKNVSRWFSHESSDSSSVQDLDNALELTMKRNGGIIDLINSETEMHVFLHLCFNGNRTYPAGSAEAAFGFAGLSVQYAYLHDEPQEVIVRRYQLIFKWCRIISLTPGAIYGWGDLETQVGDANLAVAASDLDHQRIPRLSWWSYYNKEYLKHIDRKLRTAVIWADYEDEHGLTMITYPPGEMIYATTKELVDWYL